MDYQKRKILSKAKRVVVKIGTSTITHDTGRINLMRLNKLSLVLSELINQGYEVVLVSSGAIGVGMGKLNLKKRPDSIGWKQALAAVGQCELMKIYSKLFSEYNQTVAQVLLTKSVMDDEKNRYNVKNTFNNLLKNNIIPIVNENDTVSTEEIESMDTFGDNDTLSAIVSVLIEADLLVILSDIDGFYNGNPKENEECELISTITDINDELLSFAGGVGTSRGTGGMLTKIKAAKIVTAAGVNMVIANGTNPEILFDVINGEKVGTLFCAQ